MYRKMKAMYESKQFRIDVQRDENNVQIKTMQYIHVLVISDSLRIYV